MAANGVTYRIDYDGGTGNDVVLTVQTPDGVYAEDTTWNAFTAGQAIADADFGTAGNQPAVYGYNAFGFTPALGYNAITVGHRRGDAGGTVVVNAGTYAQAVDVNKALTLNLTEGSVTLNSLAGVAGAVIDLKDDAAHTLTVGDATNTQYDGVIQNTGTGVGGLTKVGTGTLTLTGANTLQRHHADPRRAGPVGRRRCNPGWYGQGLRERRRRQQV